MDKGKHSAVGVSQKRIDKIIIPADIEKEIQQLSKSNQRITLTPLQRAVIGKMHSCGISCRRIALYFKKKFDLQVSRDFIHGKIKELEAFNVQ